MPWIFFQVSVVYPTHSENISNPLHFVRWMHTVKECSYQEWKQVISNECQYGMILEHSTERSLVELSTLSSAASRNDHARTSALQDMEKAWQESEADYFTRSKGSLARLSQDSSFWKTFQLSLLEEELKWSGKLPPWGMTVAGVLYPLHPSEHCINEKGGSCWPTPKAHDAKITGEEPSEFRRNSWSLPLVVKLIATPTASQASKPIRSPSPSTMNGTHGENLQDSIGRINPESIGKRLSVEFVECLMGYPIKYTDLEPLETLLCPSKLEKLFASCRDLHKNS